MILELVTMEHEKECQLMDAERGTIIVVVNKGQSKISMVKEPMETTQNGATI